MSRDTLMGLALLCWFVGFAVAEAIVGGGDDHQSDRQDQRLITNFSLTLIGILIASLVPLGQLTASFASGRLGVGLANAITMPWIGAFALMLLLDSLVGYWIHRSFHAAPLLWRLHRVHHADSAVDVSTSLRNHPLELLVTLPASCLVVLLCGAPVSVVAAVQTIMVAAAIWQHADIRLPARIDDVLATLIVTPRLHRLHHSPARAVHDMNFGDSFIFWDRLFGTYNGASERGTVGLEGETARPDHLIEQICWPLQPA